MVCTLRAHMNVHNKASKSRVLKNYGQPTPFEYNQITKHIFIGTNQCCTTHFDKHLLAKGITADISLEEKHLDSPWGVDYFLWLPTKNEHAPSQSQLRIGVDFLHSLIRNNIRVYVHCWLGHGRAPTLVAAYLVSTGMTAKKAIAFIKQKRKAAHLSNEQERALQKFEKESTN